jgi:hypothetical protein
VVPRTGRQNGRATARVVKEFPTREPTGGHDMADVRLTSDVEKWAANLPADYVGCRANRLHQPRTVAQEPRSFGFWRRRQCTGCGRVQEEELDHLGYRMGPAFKVEYPEGYLAPKGALESLEAADLGAAARRLELQADRVRLGGGGKRGGGSSGGAGDVRVRPVSA